MKRHRSLKIWILAIAITTACNNSTDDKFIKSFEQTKTINLKSSQVNIKQDSCFLSYIFEMKYSDSLLFINEFPDPEYCMKIVDLRNNTIRYFAKKGKGPNQMQSQACEFSIDHINHNLYVTDHNKYFVYSIDSLLNYNDAPLFSYSFKPDEAIFLKSTYSQGNIVGSAITNRFALYNLKDKSYLSKYSYPNGPMIDQADFYSHPSKNIVVFFHHQSGTMGFLYPEDNDLKMKEYSWWESKNKEIKDNKRTFIRREKDSKNGFITETVSSQYIYSLYSGKKIDPHTLKSLTNAFLTKYVHVLDWDGKPVKRFRLDQEIRSIAVDENNNVLYAGTYEGDEPHIVQYKLK